VGNGGVEGIVLNMGYVPKFGWRVASALGLYKPPVKRGAHGFWLNNAPMFARGLFA
jgi:hypothetical protein